MNKLKLDLDALRVESFEPAVAAPQLRGSVHAREVEDTRAPGCLMGYGASEIDCSSDCTYTYDEVCLAATLPPKCP